MSKKDDITPQVADTLLSVLSIIKQASFNVVGEALPLVNQQFSTLEQLLTMLQQGGAVVYTVAEAVSGDDEEEVDEAPANPPADGS